MKDKEIKRFSTIEYMAKHRHMKEVEHSENRAAIEFQNLCNEIRQFLSTPKGVTEEERRQYSETLNQAVVGFTEARAYILNVIADRLLKLHIQAIDGYNHPYHTLAEAIFSEVVGMHVLEVIIRDTPNLEEIQVVGTHIFTVISGEVTLSPYRFEHLKEVERIQQNLVLYNNDHVNIRKRWAEVMLRDGSRVTITSHGYTSLPTLTIRFYTLRNIPLLDLTQAPIRMMSPQMYTLFNYILKARYNLVIIGPTNTGKTNLLKAFIAELPAEERLITIEGRYEMMISRDFPSRNVVEYEVSEDDYLHNSNQAFKLALRQSPQRIIHAEIRDDDANVYVRACTRGHHGSMTTVHANQIEDVPETIVDMCMLDGRGMDATRLAKRITQYVTEIGIQLKFINGRRIITRIGRLYWEDEQVKVRDWVVYDASKDEWQMNIDCIGMELPHFKEEVS